MNLIKPKKLSKAETVAAICLSWGGAHAFPIRYNIGKEQVASSLGVNVIDLPNSIRPPEWLKENPSARADDFHQALRDENIKAIFSVIGGEDSIKVLPFIDQALIAKHPKIFLGYSDSTITHLLYYKNRVVSFYGPSLLTGLAENGGIMQYTEKSLTKTLMLDQPVGLVGPSMQGWSAKFSKWSDPEQRTMPRMLREPTSWQVLQGKEKAKGHLLGGCLETLAQAVDSVVWPTKEEWNNSVIFIEVSEDSPTEEKLRENFQKIIEGGALVNPAAILLGRAPEQFLQSGPSKLVNVFQDILRKANVSLSIPVIANMDFGHSDPCFIIPYGINCIVNPLDGTININENCVS